MNFIKDQYYYVEEDNGESWLIKFCEFVTDYIKCYYLHVNGYSGYFSKPEIWGKLSFIDKSSIRLATSEEKNWLEECIKQGKCVDRNSFVKPMFKKGDYIVQLAINSSESFIYGHCYKQRADHYYLLPCFDSNNRIDNGWTYIDFNKPETWRYATSEEIAEYNRLGKPYDVSVVSKSEYLKPEDLIEGNWYEGSDYYVWLFKFKKFDNNIINIHKTVNTKNNSKFEGNYNLSVENIKPANLEEVYKYFPEELLEEAKKRYPIGTEFLSACKDVESPAKCIVSDYKLDKVASNTVIWGGKIGFLFDDGNWAKVVSYPNKTTNEQYTPLSFPTDRNYLKLRVIKDIPANLNGFKNPFIPKETITWGHDDKYILIEDNRWCTNFPKEYFEVIEELVKVYVDSHIKYKDTVTNKDKLKLNIYIKPIEPIKVEPIVELKIKTVNKLTIK